MISLALVRVLPKNDDGFGSIRYLLVQYPLAQPARISRMKPSIFHQT